MLFLFSLPATVQASVTHAIVPTQETPFTITSIGSDSVPEHYDCRTREIWSEEKRHWCCANEQVGCPSHTLPTPSPVPVPPPSATLTGHLYGKSEGTYRRSVDKVNGRHIWDRTTLDGKPDEKRFLFWCGGQWRITGSQWRQDFVENKITHCGSFVSSKTAAATWYESDWGVGITAAQDPAETNEEPQPPQPATCEACVAAGRSWQVGQCNPEAAEGSGCIVADVGCFVSSSPSPSTADAREVCRPWHDEVEAKPLCGSAAAGGGCRACVGAHRLCGWHATSGECMVAPLYFMAPLKRSEEECAEGVPEAKVSAAHVAQAAIDKLRARGGSPAATAADLRAARSVLLEAAAIVARQIPGREAVEARKKERAEKKAQREARKQERTDRQQERATKKALREARQQQRADKQASKAASNEVKGKRSLRSGR